MGPGFWASEKMQDFVLKEAIWGPFITIIKGDFHLKKIILIYVFVCTGS